MCVREILFEIGKNLYEDFSDVATGFGEDCLSRKQCYEWYHRFESGRTSIEDDSKSGRSSSSKGDVHIEKLRSVICENLRLTIREVSEEVGICKSSCHAILTEKLKMHHFAAKFVPRLLTEEQKQNRVSVSQSGAIKSFEY